MAGREQFQVRLKDKSLVLTFFFSTPWGFNFPQGRLGLHFFWRPEMSLFSFFQSCFGAVKGWLARVQFELDRRAYIKAKRLMENAEEVITLPFEFGGGKLFMNCNGDFFIVEQNGSNRVFNLKVENISRQIASELAFTAHFESIDLKRQGIENTLSYKVAEQNFCRFFGSSDFCYLLAQTA